MVGLAGEGQNFDGNGTYVRFQPGGGDQTVSTGRGRAATSRDKLFGNAIAQAAGHAARLPRQAPAVQARRALLHEPRCPNLNGAAPTRRRPTAAARRPRRASASGGARAMRTAIRKHARDFAFVIGLVAGRRCVVGGYILSNQRFYLPQVGAGRSARTSSTTRPSSRPRSRSRRARARRSRSRASTSARSRKVDLVDGRAVVTMKIRRKYTPIYKDATALLRPKTGLNDMIIELDAGLDDGGRGARRAARSRSSQTLPNVNFDEILVVARHRHARATCSCWSAAPARALGGQGKALSADAQALRADRPRPRQAQRRAGRAPARTSAARSTTSACSSQALGRQGRRARRARRLLQPRLPAFADQDANLRDGAAAAARRRCDATNTALAKADALGQRARPDARRPAARRPRARAVAARRRGRSSRDTTPVIQNQLRPFARDALPVVKVLRPAAARPRGASRRS